MTKYPSKYLNIACENCIIELWTKENNRMKRFFEPNVKKNKPLK